MQILASLCAVSNNSGMHIHHGVGRAVVVVAVAAAAGIHND